MDHRNENFRLERLTYTGVHVKLFEQTCVMGITPSGSSLGKRPAEAPPATIRSVLIQKEKVMTREEAYAGCPADSYVEFYGGRWLIVPFAPVEQPHFFVCSPRGIRAL
jgi:hypothetical protein